MSEQQQSGQQPQINPLILNVVVKSPDYTHFNGPATGVTSHNHTGRFDVLALHASFITLIQEGIVIYKPNKQQVSIKIKKGVMKVFKNNVQVFIGIEIKE